MKGTPSLPREETGPTALRHVDKAIQSSFGTARSRPKRSRPVYSMGVHWLTWYRNDLLYRQLKVLKQHLHFIVQVKITA